MTEVLRQGCENPLDLRQDLLLLTVWQRHQPECCKVCNLPCQHAQDLYTVLPLVKVKSQGLTNNSDAEEMMEGTKILHGKP